MLAFALAGVLVASTPYYNAQLRFALDLPDGWSVAPFDAGAGSVVLQRKSADTLAMAVVRSMPAEGSVDLQATARQLGDALQSEPGYRVLAEDLDTLGPLPAVRRRYSVWINRDSRLVKQVDERVAIGGDRLYVLHVEALASSYVRFGDDFDMLAHTFRPTGGAGRRPNRPEELSMVVGDWAMEGSPDTVLTLRPDGTFSLAGNDGHYWIEGPSLITSIGGGREERLDWELSGDELVLHGGALSSPIRYRRQGTTQPSAEMLANQELAGHWRGGGHFLAMSAAGTVILDGLDGTFVAKDGVLVFMLRGKSPERLKYRLRKTSLVISGGAFGKAMQMMRQSTPNQP